MDLTDRVAQRLKLRDLRLLDVVVRSKSMARAAAQLNLSQPAVSKAISEMEQVLGVRLLDRSRQGAEPTPYGRALLKSAVAIFDDLRQGVREIEFLSDPAAGDVRIAATEPIASGLLPIVVARLTRQYPRISIYMTQSPIAVLERRTPQYRDLRERNVDLVLGPFVRPFAEDDLEAELLFEEKPTVVAGMHSKWARRRKVELADLIDEPWCMAPPDTLVGSRCVEAFRASGLDVPKRTVLASSIQLYNGLLATERFLAIMPDSLLKFSAKRFGLKGLPIELPVPPRFIGIVTVKNRTISPAARVFIDMTREVTKPLAKANLHE
ncbi:MAG TPA: LysR family transcriptional regulator [Xanthobacteraceae bacterium]|jgi:DNA-binding transcriptional LysR family regulator|nr:LysR family transcriptional regulator [Xanthobacteraceae bacterium]